MNFRRYFLIPQRYRRWWFTFKPPQTSLFYPLMTAGVIGTTLFFLFGRTFPLSLSSGHPLGILFGPFIFPPTSPLILIILALWFTYGQSRARQKFDPQPLITIGILVLSVHLLSILVGSRLTWGLIIEALLLAWLLPVIERRWSRSRCISFIISLLTISYLVSGVAIQLGVVGHLSGFGPLHRGLMIIWAQSMGRMIIPILNVRGETLKWVILGICVFEFILSGSVHSIGHMVGALFAWWMISGKKDLRNLSRKLNKK